jgi:hypothetical protein
MATTIIVVLLLVLIAIKVPIAISMGVTAVVYFLYLDIPMDTIVQKAFGGVNSFEMTAIPLFMLAGELMNYGGISDRLMRFAKAFLGHVRGGFGVATVFTCMVFGGAAGSTLAEIAAIGPITIPEMVKQGYKREFAAAIVGVTSELGPIIPPSVIMVIAASLAQVSVGKMLLSGLIPGLLKAGQGKLDHPMDRNEGQFLGPHDECDLDRRHDRRNFYTHRDRRGRCVLLFIHRHVCLQRDEVKGFIQSVLPYGRIISGDFICDSAVQFVRLYADAGKNRRLCGNPSHGIRPFDTARLFNDDDRFDSAGNAAVEHAGRHVGRTRIGAACKAVGRGSHTLLFHSDHDGPHRHPDASGGDLALSDQPNCRNKTRKDVLGDDTADSGHLCGTDPIRIYSRDHYVDSECGL